MKRYMLNDGSKNKYLFIECGTAKEMVRIGSAGGTE